MTAPSSCRGPELRVYEAAELGVVAEAAQHLDVQGQQVGAARQQAGLLDAASIVWAATLPDDGPTGGFFRRDGRPLPW